MKIYLVILTLIMSLCLSFEKVQASSARGDLHDDTPINVLCIDGGGRGIIPALMVCEIERVTGLPITSFDVFVGTSMGGILAAALALANPEAAGPSFSTQSLVEFFRTQTSAMFQNHGCCSFFNKTKYTNQNFKDLLGNMFGDRALGACSRRAMLMATDDFTACRVVFDSENSAWKSMPVREACLATCASPTYLPSVYVKGPDQWFIDGSVGASNPALEALRRLRNQFPTRRINLVSLGTGSDCQSSSLDELERKGFLAVSKPSLDRYCATQSELTHHELKALAEGETMNITYCRFQVALRPGQLAMDQTSPKDIQGLEDATRAAFAGTHETIMGLTKMLNPTGKRVPFDSQGLRFQGENPFLPPTV